MATANFNVGFRPLRVGLLVRRGIRSDLLAAIQHNTRFWGGMRNPIIEVDSDHQRARSVLESFEIDILCAVTQDAAIQHLIDEYPWLDQPGPTRSVKLFESSDGGFPLVDIRRITAHYAFKYFRHDVEQSRATLVRWATDDPLGPLWSATFGSYGTDEFAARFEQAFMSLRAQEESIDVVAAAPAELRSRLTTIELTSDRLIPARTRSPGHGLVIGDSQDAEHLIRFWNLRASGSDVVFWAVDAPNRTEQYCLEHFKQVTDLAAERGAAWSPNIWLCDEGIDVPDPVTAFAAKTKGEFAKLQVHRDPWHTITRSSVWETSSTSVLGSVETNQFGTRQAAIAIPTEPFDNAEGEPHWLPRWLVTVSATGEFDYSGYTVRIPSVPPLNRWAARELGQFHELRLNGGTVGIVARPGETNVRMRLVRHEDLAAALFDLIGFKATLSPAGRATKQIIAQMGGLERCRLFRLHGVRELLRRPSRPYSWQEAMQCIEDKGAFKRYVNVPSVGETFRRLLDNEVFNARMEIQCPECTVRSRYTPEALATDLRCPRCRREFALSPLVKAASWRYEASGFFETPNQHGALPVILAMMRLEHAISTSSQVIVPSLELVNQNMRCEVDLVSIVQGYDGSLTLAVGECKGGNDQILDTDVANLEMIVNGFDELGIKCVPLFATIRDEFSDDEIEQFRDMSKRLITGPVLLTKRELECFDCFPRELADKLPMRFQSGFNDLSVNSRFLFLTQNGPYKQRLEHDFESWLI